MEKLIVLYRMAPNEPKKSPILKDNKYEFLKLTLKSFYEGFKDLRPDVVFLCDNCPYEYYDLIADSVDFNYEIRKYDGIGNWGTYSEQIEIASTLNDYVLLLEDDYLFLPEIGSKLLSGMKEFDFVTPQDEFFYYFNEPRHDGKFKIKVVDDHHWREVNSTTLTFGAHSDKFKDIKGILTGHHIWDYPMWQDIRKYYELWVPIPSFATHMVENQLAPTIRWEDQWRN